jgi:hypothetical protein
MRVNDERMEGRGVRNERIAFLSRALNKFSIGNNYVDGTSILGAASSG